MKKQDGSVRIVVDFRKLNEKSVAEPFYMPICEEVIARLGPAKFLTKLDLAKGFHQIPMAPESRHLTAFSCKFGKYEYLRMPFGLKNAPATFQLVMQKCLIDLESFSSPYIDDIIVFSITWAEHLKHIAAVLERLKVNGFTIKLNKCLWGCSAFEFLGYEVEK